MASSKVELTQGVWTQITTTDKEGSIFHRAGSSRVAYLEAATLPTGFDGDTPAMEYTLQEEGFPYWGVAATDFIYAYAINGDAEIVVSPKGV